MVDRIFNIENTLVIGQHTAGMLVSTQGWDMFYLSNSAIPFTFGPVVTVHPHNHFYEGLGFAPDIFVIGDALNATLNMLQKNTR